MIKIIHAVKGKVEMLTEAAKGCWIQVIRPTPEDIAYLEKLGVGHDYIKYALDEEELARSESENGQTLIIVDLPTAPENARKPTPSTMPVAFILINDDFLISVSVKENDLFDEILKVASLNTANRTKTILQFLGKASIKYMQALKEIDRIVSEIEKRAVKSVGRGEILELMEVQSRRSHVGTD